MTLLAHFSSFLHSVDEIEVQMLRTQPIYCVLDECGGYKTEEISPCSYTLCTITNPSGLCVPMPLHCR